MKGEKAEKKGRPRKGEGEEERGKEGSEATESLFVSSFFRESQIIFLLIFLYFFCNVFSDAFFPDLLARLRLLFAVEIAMIIQ